MVTSEKVTSCADCPIENFCSDAEYDDCFGCPSAKDCDAFDHGNYDRRLLRAFLSIYPNTVFTRLSDGQEADNGHVFKVVKHD